MTSFGRDISCTTELRTGRFASGVRLVAEALYRRLTTPRGTLRGGEEEASYGMDLTGMIGSARTKEDAASLPGRIRQEAKKDERIEDVNVSVIESTSATGAVSFTISIDATTAEGAFSLQLRVSEVTVELLGLTVED